MWPPRHYSLKVEVAKLPLAWQEESVVRKVEYSPAHQEYTVPAFDVPFCEGGRRDDWPRQGPHSGAQKLSWVIKVSLRARV